MLAASLAPAGQAHAARERSPEEEAASAAGKAAKQAERTEREERAAAEKAQRASEKAAARSERAAARAEDETQSGGRRKQNSSRERPHGDVHFSCTEVTWRFKDFNEGSNTIIGVLRIFSQDPPRRIPETFTFDGPGDEFTVPIPITDQFAGTYKVDSWAKWKGNGVKGSWDILGKLTCAPKPAFSIEKLQKIAGGSGSYTSSTITGQVGDTVDYQIVVKNTGNVPLTLGSFTDPHCDSGTVSGGPGDNALAVGESTTFTCTHPLDEAGSYTNTATVTGTPPDGDGSPVTNTSNTVLAEVSPVPPIALPAFSIEKLQKIAGGSGSYTSSTITGQVGQTVEYEILVRNTGIVPLTLGSFTDPHCDSGTLSGGPGGTALPVGESTTYRCAHLLSKADEAAGSYTNTATVTGTPPAGEGSPVTNTSNTVVVDVPSSSTAGTHTSGSSGVLSSTVSQPPRSGVLAFSSVSVPKLKGPEGCVRGEFHVSIKSAHVASVTFYLDGRKLKTLTAKNAHKGLLTIAIDPSKLKVGAHKLVAKITMTHTASTKAKQGTRSMMVLRCRAAVLTPKFTG